MNSTKAVEVSIHAVSPELIFDASTEYGAVGAAGAASDAAAATAAEAGAAAALASDAAAAGADAIGADAADDASSACATPSPAPSNDPAIRKVNISLRISDFPSILSISTSPDCARHPRRTLSAV
jgi:hypothetical protein